MVGVMDDKGLLPGLIKLDGAGGLTPAEAFLGIEKSSISLFKTIPVLGESIREPKYEFMVLVMDTAFRFVSTTDKWLVPCSSI